MTSQRVEMTWIRTGGYGRFRGEWVNDDIDLGINYYYHHHHHHHPLTTEVDRTFIEISSQTPRFAIAVLRSLVLMKLRMMMMMMMMLMGTASQIETAVIIN